MNTIYLLAVSALSAVSVTRAPMEIPTYEVGRPDRNPMFFEKRVYQGSCGKVYPVPFIDKVFDERKPKRYDAVTLENDYVRVVLLPEIGGRIYIGQDKANGDYDFFYRNDVIKPALVGLAGPWLSGGVEFNWPQHHRPATFLPTDVEIEREPDGGVTVWMSDHDPIFRLYSRHGIGLKPGSSVVRLRATLYNRTPMTQTFHWWANVAARVHDRYESFFPPDVDYVADHAVRAVSSFPLANNPYYGVDYAGRPGANDLRWYRNIPVPTSYMICDTRFDFFGGYDHAAEGGFVHVADRHVAPGKKQWTWGNAPFGYAWDRELTDTSGPYIELMAGVYTDNQPDFTYLLPFETKTFTQCWWPYAKIGPVLNANERAALNFRGVAVSEDLPCARIELKKDGKVLKSVTADLAVGRPHVLPAEAEKADEAAVLDRTGRVVVACRRTTPPATSEKDRRPAATEPPQPKDIASADELFLVAEHLDQYRHPTRHPETYLDEILRRDPLDSRAHILYAKRLIARGLFAEAEDHAAKAVSRLTRRHPNPYTGEAHYYLGLARWYLGDPEGAYEGFAKSAWNHEFAASARRMTDTIRAARGEDVAFEEPPRVLDTWDPERRLDYAYEDIARGRFAAADGILERNGDHAMSRCVRAHLALRADAKATVDLAALKPDYFFPSRLEDYVVLRDLDARLGGTNAVIRYALGNFLYDRRRHEEALACWQSATELDPAFPTAWRNLGVALWNVRHDGKGAQSAYRRAMAADPADARLVAEYDQLCEKCRVTSAERFAFLESKKALVFTRDDATVAYATLLNDLGRCDAALDVLRAHRFHPWEGGEGKVLLQWARACATQAARSSGARAAQLAREAFDPPANLGETFHLVLDDPELKCYKAMAMKAEGRADEARALFAEALAQAKKGLEGEIKIDYFATSLPLLLIFDDDYAAVTRAHLEKIVRLAEAGLAFGTTKYGEQARLYTLQGKGGLKMEVTDYGGRVSRLWVPDAKGELVDVTVGFDSPAGWDATDVYFGAIVGRFANRIANGTFALDGRTYTLAQNDASRHASLHGGSRGWDGYVWNAETFAAGDDVGIRFSRVSPDGEEGFPGTVTATVTYTITPANVWRIEYEATTDKTTPVNLTQHVYFNLNGSGTILDQELQIAAAKYSPVNADLAPVGPAADVAGTPFDFREFRVIGERIDDPDPMLRFDPGYNHNWVLDGKGFRKVAEMRGKARAMEVWTDQVGLQFYAGNYIDDKWTMKDGRPLRRRGYLALETQHFPNSPNRPDFPTTNLKPGEKYRTVTEYRFKTR